MSAPRSQIKKPGFSLITKEENFLRTFALSVADHYVRCGPWRKLLASKTVTRDSDCYLFHGSGQDYGFTFCPCCGTQVILLITEPGKLIVRSGIHDREYSRGPGLVFSPQEHQRQRWRYVQVQGRI